MLGIILKDFTCTKNPQKVIITGPLRKAINRKRIGKEGVRQWKVKNQRVREGERETESKPPREEGRQLYTRYRLSSYELSIVEYPYTHNNK